MPQNNLGPKTGTFEPPSESTFDKPRGTKRLLKVDEQFKSTMLYECLYALTAELIEAYEKKDKKAMKILIDEFKGIK